MKFKRYSSIDRNDKIHSGNYSKALQTFLENGYGDTKCIYQQKVHGANFSVYVDEENVRAAKRSDFLELDEKFMGNRWVKYVDDVKPKLQKIFKKLQEENPKISQVAFVGEFAGGAFKDEKGEGAVQGGTHYCKNNFIYFFDIRIFFENSEGEVVNTIINPLKSVELFEEFDVFHAKILGHGTLSELIKVEDFKNYVSLDLEGEQVVESEGIVIKSVEESRLYMGQSRIVLKKINPKWAENQKSRKNNKKSKNADDGMPKEAVDLLIQLKTFVTPMRLDKVCGNLGLSEDNFEGKDFPKVMKAMFADIIGDAAKEDLVIQKEWKKYLNKKISSEIAQIIRKKFF